MTPIRPKYIVIALAVAGLAIGLWSHFRTAHAGGHSHGGHESAALALNNGQRWETDQSLRTGMQRIRDAVQPVVEAHPNVTAAQTEQLAGTIQENVSYLVTNCKLSPKADATLHVFITDLLSGAGMLKTDPRSTAGLSLMAEALRKYPDYFDHPEWKPLSPARS